MSQEDQLICRHYNLASFENPSKQVDQLKVDIEKLKEENDIKINILANVHCKELEELKTTN